MKSPLNTHRLQNKFYNALDVVWSKLHPTVGQCLATVLIFFAGIAMKGDWLLLLVHFAKQFYVKPDPAEESTVATFRRRMDGLPYYVTLSIINSYILYFGLCGFLQWYFYVRQIDRPEDWKCQPKKFLTWEDEKHEIIMGTVCLTIGSCTSGFLACWIMNGGYSSLYYNVNDYGIIYFILSIPISFLAIEALFYYYHRSFHLPWFYKRFHKMHHRYKQPTAFSSTALHPVEFLIIQTSFIVPMFVIPIHYGVYITIVLYNYYYGIMDHSGIKMEAIWPWQPNTSFHDNHHEFFHTNFGFNLKLFDYFHGTLRKDDRIYNEDIFYGYGKKIETATAEERKKYIQDH